MTSRQLPDYPTLRSHYNAFLTLERGLSENTRINYLADADRLVDWLQSVGQNVYTANLECIQGFIIDLHQLGISPRSQARIISGIKSLYRYLKTESLIDDNPTLLLESPRLGRKLPDILTVEEIDDMVDAIDMTRIEGQRNRAIIETLYGCGLRVSELCNLRIDNINFDDGLLMVIGKGDKQRLVPMSPTSIDEIRRWLLDRSRITVKRGEEGMLFISRRGRRLTRVMVFYIVRDLAEAAGVRKEISPTLCAIRLRPICSKAVPTCGPSSKCSATKASPPPSSTSISTNHISAKKFSPTTPATPAPTAPIEN